ncbi:Protein of unknown function [Gryllus bimaculatus]|nr:Protein of unknown function [Gryllus bimaculatus]
MGLSADGTLPAGPTSPHIAFSRALALRGQKKPTTWPRPWAGAGHRSPSPGIRGRSRRHAPLPPDSWARPAPRCREAKGGEERRWALTAPPLAATARRARRRTGGDVLALRGLGEGGGGVRRGRVRGWDCAARDKSEDLKGGIGGKIHYKLELWLATARKTEGPLCSPPFAQASKRAAFLDWVALKGEVGDPNITPAAVGEGEGIRFRKFLNPSEETLFPKNPPPFLCPWEETPVAATAATPRRAGPAPQEL